MAEIAEPPVVAAPEATPAAQPEAPAGIKEAMKDFADLTTLKPKEPAAPAKPVTEEPAKPDATKPDPAKPVVVAKPEKADIWSKAPGNLKGEHFKTVRQYEDKIGELTKQIKAVEAKPKEAPGDAKLVEHLQKQIAEREQKIAALDYKSSEAFRKEHTNRINAEYKDHLEEIKSLKVYSKDADGNEISRAATKEDYDRLFNLSPVEQDAAIAAFGTSAYRVAGMMRSLVSMSRASERAITEHAEKAELTAKEKSIAADREKGAYDKAYEGSIAELQKTYPQYFAPDENDPEASAALDGGYKFVDGVLSKAEAMNVNDRAAYNAVLRARAAGFPRAVFDNNRLRAEVESLKAELGKFRKSDPGSAEGDKGGAAPSGEDEVPAGIGAASAQFK